MADTFGDWVGWLCASVVTSLRFPFCHHSLLLCYPKQINPNTFTPFVWVCMQCCTKQDHIENATHKSMKFLPILIYFRQDNLDALSVQHIYNTNRDKSEKWTQWKLYKSKKKKKEKKLISNLLPMCNKSLIISLSGKLTFHDGTWLNAVNFLLLHTAPFHPHILYSR